jgi:hypothetical protein
MLVYRKSGVSLIFKYMIELTTAIFFLVSSLYGSANVAVAQDVNDSINTQGKTAVVKPVTLESYVREYFAETPILAEIARCESSFRHVGKDGKVLRGEVNKSDLGLLQVNKYYHGEKAEDLGFDLMTVDGNLAYAKYLYDKEGTAPWNASKKCWSK